MTASEGSRRLVLIVGATRSGTTILSRLLADAWGWERVHEPRIVWRLGNDGRSDLLRPNHLTPALVASIRKGILEEAPRERRDTDVVIEKTPSNALRLPFVHEIFPDALVIHIVRDARAAVPSIVRRWKREGSSFGQRNLKRRINKKVKQAKVRQYPYYAKEFARKAAGQLRERFGADKPGGGEAGAWGPRLPGLEQMSGDVGVLETAAIQWAQCVQAARFDGPRVYGDQFLELRYEDLNAETLEQVANFLGMTHRKADLLAVFHETFRSSSEPLKAWQSLTDQERDIVRRWCEPMQEAFGYPVE